MSALRALSLLSLLVLSSSARAETQVARFAIVVGNNTSEERDSAALRYADDDAVATHRLLLEAGVASVLLVRLDEDSRRLNPDLRVASPPRLRDFERAFAEVAASMRQLRKDGVGSELLLFYSGHGDVDGGEGYVVLEDERLTRSALYDLLSGSPAIRNHVFIDACKSYFLAFEKGPGGAREPYTKAFEVATVPGQLASTGFVLSTSSDRDSHEWERYQAGILSHELRSALRGAADADGDRSVTYAEIGAFLAAANRGIANPRFRPDFMVRPPTDALRTEILNWSPQRSAVVVHGAELGHLYVEGASGERVLDVHADAASAVTLHLPDERPMFLRSNDDRREVMIATRDPVVVTTLGTNVQEVARRGAIHLAFAQLFAAPFGSADVVTFERSHREAFRAQRDGQQQQTLDRRQRVRLTAGVLALAGAAAGLALSSAALVEYRQGAEASQVELHDLNRRVRRLNLASISGYALTTVAAATWAWLFAKQRRSVLLTPALQLSSPDRAHAVNATISF